MKRVLAVLAVLLLAWLAWEWFTFPDVASLAKEPPRTTAFMELRKRELQKEGKSDAIDYRWVPYGRISSNLRRAVLVAEDDSFYEHDGVDVSAMKEAFERNWEHRRVASGGSTITQQLAKNLYLSPSRNPVRKIKEFFIARSLERHLTKKRILEIYLNVVEMGERVYGAEAAARHYFHEPASALAPREAALLAGCLPNPRIMSPASPNKRLRWRQQMILSRMHRWGYVFERQVLAEKKPVASEPEISPTATSAPVTDTDVSANEPETTTETSAPPSTDTADTTTATPSQQETTDTAPPPDSPPSATTGTPPL